MKKFYFLAAALFAATTLSAQTIVDFEDLTLPAAETFYEGADGAGGFTSEGVHFGIQYDTDYNFLSAGFAYTNVTDNTTPGFANMYSAYPGSGADGSEIYAVSYSMDTITMPAGAEAYDLISAEITNTTYAYLSMRDGDSFGKKFGTSTDANGDDDGTNGEDYFYITIYGLDANKQSVASVDFYLADFRSPTADDHYIIEDWTPVDLSALTGVKYLTFSYASSDIGEFGINTPLYFALDNLTFEDETAGIPNYTQSTFNVYPNPASHTLNIEGNGDFTLYNVNGVKILEIGAVNTVDVSAIQAGVYFIKNKLNNQTQKLIIR